MITQYADDELLFEQKGGRYEEINSVYENSPIKTKNRRKLHLYDVFCYYVFVNLHNNKYRRIKY